ncbi:MAG TPA: hypothetical protein VMH81_13255 [Bryobacteraceae bacterium]|nr:hypothetical protein [Bryobacteraceae bacterium]
MDEDRNAPATKGDLRDLQASMQEMEGRMNERHEMLRSEFDHAFDDLKEVMRDVQTELLKAFYSYSQNNDTRVAAMEDDTASLRKRLGLVESRVTELERRLLMPPPE